MGFFDFLRGPDMDAGVEQCRHTPGALLLDVRTEGEYAEGHIPGAKNLPLQSLAGIATVALPRIPRCFSTAAAAPAAARLPASCSAWATPG